MEQGRRPDRQGEPRSGASRHQPEDSYASRPRPRADSPAARRAGAADSARRPANAQGAQERGRPRRPKKKGVFSNPLVYLLFVFGISAILAALGWTAANDVLALNKPKGEDLIVVQENDSFSDVVNQLEEKGMIEYKFVFRVFSAFTGGADKITPGAYWMNTEMDYRAILGAMSARSGNRYETKITIPEGYNIDQIFQLLEDNGISTVEKLQDMAATHDYAFSFLADIPLGDYRRLEGYLFPDTYDFLMGENPRFILNKMLVNFDSKLTDALRTQIGNSSYTIRDILIIASMIEKETDGEDRANISSVIHNRLERQNSETNGRLEIDATLQYVLPEGEYVTQAHYQSLDSSYNTYLHQGLPPGPIANPGMASILAAMNPASTNYFYYALGSNGRHQFSNTYAEHQAFLAQQ